MNGDIDGTQFERLFEQAVARSFEGMVGAVPPRGELEKLYRFSDAHNARMKQLFRRVGRAELFKKFARAAASLAAVALVCFGVLLATSPDIRAAVGDVVVEWFDGFTSFIRDGREEDRLATGSLRPQYLPEGFTLSEELAFGDMEMLTYENAGGETIQLTIALYGQSSVNNEGVVYKTASIGGTVYHIFESVDGHSHNIIVWEAFGYEFDLISTVSPEQLQKIAVSVSNIHTAD